MQDNKEVNNINHVNSWYQRHHPQFDQAPHCQQCSFNRPSAAATVQPGIHSMHNSFANARMNDPHYYQKNVKILLLIKQPTITA